MRKHMTKILEALLLLSAMTSCEDDANSKVSNSTEADTT